MLTALFVISLFTWVVGILISFAITYDCYYLYNRPVTKTIIINIFWPISLIYITYIKLVNTVKKVKIEIKEGRWWKKEKEE